MYAAVKIVSKIHLVNSRRSIHNLGEEAERILLSLEREIVIMKLIDHPNIMRLYDVWETSGELYLIMEYVEGGELFDYICEQGRLGSDEALDYFQQLIGAMDYCHRFNIAHRDLKPENLLLDKDKNLKVADFGMAAWQGGDDLLQTSCGSPHYAAPEVVSGEPYDGSCSDTWSCGVILFALLSGRLPFDDPNMHLLLNKVKVGSFVMPTDIDTGAQDLIKKLLEKDPKKRIKIADILKHPWYNSRPPRNSICAPPSLDELAKPVRNASDIDMDIFGNLKTLWHGAPDEDIIKSLVSSEQTWEKAVYHLLLKYRTSHLENYNEEQERYHLRKKMEEKQKRKRRKRSENTQADRKTVAQRTEQERPKTPMTLPPRPDPPTPNRAIDHQKLSLSNATAHHGPPLPSSPMKSVVQSLAGSPRDSRLLPPAGNYVPASQNPSLLSPMTMTPSTLLNSPLSITSPESPLWEALDVAPPIDVPELQDENVQRFFQQIVDHLNTMQNKTGISSNVNQTAPGLRAPLVPTTGLASNHDPKHQMEKLTVPQVDGRGLGIINEPIRNAEKENQNAKKKSSLRRPKDDSRRAALADRHVQIVLPPPIERDTGRGRVLSCDSHSSHSPTFSLSEGSSSFAIPSSAKRSWFTNLFKFRPAVFTLFSACDTHTSMDVCRNLLMSLGVRVTVIQSDDTQGGCLLCQLDEVRDPAGLMAVTKAVRFRVEARILDERQTMLEMIQEKGALSSFKLVYQRLRKQWDLDMVDAKELVADYPGSIQPSKGYDRSPIPTMGRFVENIKY